MNIIIIIYIVYRPSNQLLRLLGQSQKQLVNVQIQLKHVILIFYKHNTFFQNGQVTLFPTLVHLIQYVMPY